MTTPPDPICTAAERTAYTQGASDEHPDQRPAPRQHRPERHRRPLPERDTPMPPAAKAPAKPDDFLRQAVKKAMGAHDHNTTDTAEAAGIHRLDLHRWLSGERGIRSEKLGKVMKYLGITVTPYSNKAPKK